MRGGVHPARRGPEAVVAAPDEGGRRHGGQAQQGPRGECRRVRGEDAGQVGVRGDHHGGVPGDTGPADGRQARPVADREQCLPHGALLAPGRVPGDDVTGGQRGRCGQPGQPVGESRVVEDERAARHVQQEGRRGTGGPYGCRRRVRADAGRGGGVQVHRGEAVRPVTGRASGEQQGEPGAAGRAAQQRRVVGRVQRHAHAARLQDGEGAHQFVDRAVEVQAGPGARGEPGRAQPGRERAHARGEFRVGQGRAGGPHGRRPGAGRHLGGEQPRHGGVGVESGVRAGNRVQDQVVVLGEEGQLADGPGGVRQRALEHLGEVRRHAFQGGAVEQVGAVDEGAAQPVRVVPAVHLQVEAGGALLDGDPLRVHAVELESAELVVLEREGDLEQRVGADAALRCDLLHDLLERDVVVRVGALAHLPHPAQDAGEGGVAREVRAHRQGVDERADERLGLGVVAPGHRGAEDEVVLAGVAVQEGGDPGEQHHVQGDALRPAHLPQARGELLVEGEVEAGADEGAGLGARPVGRQPQLGQIAAQPRTPVVQSVLQRRPVQLLGLPFRVVAVLDGQFRQLRGLARPAGPVGLGEFPEEDAQGPAVHDDVVHRQDEEVVGGRGAHQGGAQQRAVLQVEGGLDEPGQLLAHRGHLVRGRPVGRGAGGLVHGKRDVHGVGDDLAQLAVVLAERRAQRLVALHDVVQGRPEHGGVQFTGEPVHHRHVVEGAVRVQAVEEPQSLLGVGGRELQDVGRLLGGRPHVGGGLLRLARRS